MYAEAPRPFVGAGHWPARHIEDGKAAHPGRPRPTKGVPLQSGRVRAPAPTADVETYLSFRRGRSQTGPREGHTPGWLLSAFGRFTFSPSPTTCPERFQFFVGELLEAPAGACRGHPHLSGLTASHLPPRRGKALRAADSRPHSGKRARSVGSAKPGAVHKPQQRQFLQTQGPVARNETIKVTQILRAGNPAT